MDLNYEPRTIAGIEVELSHGSTAVAVAVVAYTTVPAIRDSGRPRRMGGDSGGLGTRVRGTRPVVTSRRMQFQLGRRDTCERHVWLVLTSTYSLRCIERGRDILAMRIHFNDCFWTYKEQLFLRVKVCAALVATAAETATIMAVKETIVSEEVVCWLGRRFNDRY